MLSMKSRRMFRSIFTVVSFLLLFQGLGLLARTFPPQVSVCNRAGFFGLPFPTILSLGLAVTVLGTLFFLWWKKRDEPISPLWLILFSGGLSNVLERLQYGCVFDYFKLPLWPLFNVADVALFTSVVFLVWREYRKDR